MIARLQCGGNIDPDMLFFICNCQLFFLPYCQFFFLPWYKYYVGSCCQCASPCIFHHWISFPPHAWPLSQVVQCSLQNIPISCWSNLTMSVVSTMQSSASLMKTLNRQGPNTVPSGTPESTSPSSENTLSTLTLCFLPFNKLLNPAHNFFTSAFCFEFFNELLMWNLVKCFTEV